MRLPMFGRGKKQTPAKKGKGKDKGNKAPRAAPLRYLGAVQTMQYGQNIVKDVRGLEAVAFPVIGLIALLTYRSEHKRQVKAQAAADEAAIHSALLNQLDPDRPKRKKLLGLL